MSQPATEPPARRRIKEMEAMIADVVVETPDTATLVLFTGNERLDYKPGHFLTVDPHQFKALERFTHYLEDQKGKREPVRAYSLASSPHEKRIAFTVKEERYTTGVTKYPPLLSPLLVRRMPRGTPIQITGFTGPYILADDIEEKTEHAVHICAGSGVVPNFSMIKSSLFTGKKLKHSLLFSNKVSEDIIFRREFEALERQFPDRFRVVYSLTRESESFVYDDKFVKGRVTSELVKRMFRDTSADYVYLCGPAISPWDRQAAKAKGETAAPRFMETVLSHLAALGVPKQHVLHESYG